MLKAFLQGRWLGHPIHTALVHIPTALWPAALVFDVLSNTGGGNPVMVRTSFYAILLGLLVALLAVPTGLADWLDIQAKNPAKRLGRYHLILNLTIAALQGLNLGLRINTLHSAASVPAGLTLLSLVATALLLVSGYLGGRMVYDYGISVARVSKKKWRQIAIASGANVPAGEGR
ncbi:MAG TPA: DUF2231 domain-containing protein [Anaerolineae bacterium]|nr:DUF2231 domain-containing protein [Anaerolineae bacterium]